MENYAYLSSRSIWDEVTFAGILRGNLSVPGLDPKSIDWPIKTSGNLKLSYLWNEKICLPFPRDFSEYIIEASIKGHELSSTSERELRESIVAIDEALLDNDPQDDTMDTQIRVVAESISRLEEENSDEPGGYLDIEKAVTVGALMIFKTLKNWYLLKKKHICSFYGILSEYKSFNQIYQKCRGHAKIDALSEISGIRLPSLEVTPWEKIIELRHSPYIDNFRSKIDFVVDQLKSGEEKSANAVLEEIVSKDLRELARKVRPNTRTILLKGVAGMWFPFIPISPVGLATTINDYQKEKKKEEDFGWLYFVLDMEV